MATAEAALAALESIARDMRLLVAHFGAEARPAAATTAYDGPTEGHLASDRDLDSQYGNPQVKTKDPRDWTGPTMRERRFSECPVEYLDQYAPFLDWMANQSRAQAEDPTTPPEDVSKALKTVKYKRLDASRARGWAQRLRNGWKPTEPEPTADLNPITADDIAF